MKKDKFSPSSYVIFSKKLPWIIRLRDIILTILIWGLYFYFMEDFAIFVHDAGLWIAHGYDNPAQYPGLKILPDVVAFIKITALLVSLLVGWSYYNLIRYGKKKRRSAAPSVPIELTASDYGVDPRDLKSWQGTKLLTMHLDSLGRVSKVEKG